MPKINKIIFMGTPQFAVPTLKALLNNNETVVAVICQPDRPQGRGRKLTPPPVKVLAEQHNIQVLQPTKIKTAEFQQTLIDFAADLFIVTAYGRILPESILNIPPLGTINVHGSILPKYRGAAPIQRAILNGETETGVTIMQMDAGMDTGDILLPKTLPIDINDTSETLAEKMADLGGELLITALNLLREDKLPPIKQDDTKATPAPPLLKEEGEINWQNSAEEISWQIRGLDPWPKAHSQYGEKWIRLFKPQVIDDECHDQPGYLTKTSKKGLYIVTGKGHLLVSEVQLQGKKQMAVDAFLRGHQMPIGTIFGKRK